MTTPLTVNPRFVWLIICCLLLGGCATPGPLGKKNFDDSFSRTIEPEERLEHYARCNVYAGTYMEGEMDSVPVHEGVAIMTDHRLIFSQWHDQEQRYQPLIWILYKDIKRLKKQNDSLLKFIAIEGPGGSKNSYHMPGNDVEIIYKKIAERVVRDFRH